MSGRRPAGSVHVFVSLGIFRNIDDNKGMLLFLGIDEPKYWKYKTDCEIIKKV